MSLKQEMFRSIFVGEPMRPSQDLVPAPGCAIQEHRNITTTQDPEDNPEFKRIYKAQLDHRAHITVEARTWDYMGRRFSGELRQPNGNRIYFEPERIADKIIDPVLVPLVEACVRVIFDLDREFMRTAPNEFYDKKGRLWRLAA